MRGKLRDLLVQLRFWGARGIARSLHYSVISSWASLKRPRRRGPFIPVGPAVRAEASRDGATVRFVDAACEVRFLASDIVRITWTPGTIPAPYAIATDDWPGAAVTTERTGHGWTLQTDGLSVAIARDGAVTVRAADGTRLREERPPERRGETWRQRAVIAPGERLFGLGEHTGPFDLRGRRHRLWNTDPMRSYGPGEDPLYMGIPVLQSVRPGGPHLVFHENTHAARFVFADEAVAEFEGGALRSYIIAGAPDRALERYTRLTGRPPLPPRWALGYHQSRFSYKTEEEVREVVDGFRDRGLPLSAIHLDIHYMDGFRVFTVDPDRFPDLRRLACELAGVGVRLVAILDPGVKRDTDYSVYREGVERDLFCRARRGTVAHAPVWPGWSAFPDFTGAETRAWWSEHARSLADLGLSGLWTDMNEPALVALWGERTLAQDIVHHFDGRGGTHAEGHNTYGLLMARATRDGLARARPDCRPFVLTRSGWAGVQREAWMWTGDISSGWPMLRQTVVTILGLGMSGMPYAGPDIGGFKGSLTTEEYLRWFELAAFLPFFRTHSSQSVGRREPWCFGEETLDSVRALLALRMSLMPYLYTLAWEASRTGHPLVRPLFWPQSDDERLATESAFLLGRDLLVAPVLGPGERTRTTPLPPGTWVHHWTGEAHSHEATVEAPPGRPPLFVRSGAVLPRDEDGALALHVYPPGSGRETSAVYHDAGDGDGPSRVDTFILTARDGAVELAHDSEGDFPFPRDGAVIVLHGPAPVAVEVDGEARAPAVRIAVPPGFRRVRFVVTPPD